MRYLSLKWGILGLLLVTGCAKLNAGPWNQDKGHGILIVGLNRYWANQRFDADGRTREFNKDGNFRSLVPNVWLEMGLSDHLTGILSFSIPQQSYIDSDYRARSLSVGDVHVGLRQAVRRSPSTWQLAIQGLIKVPAYSSNIQPQPGNGQVDFEPSFLAGRSFPVGSRWGFLSSELGYRVRFGRPVNQFRGELAGGLHLNNQVTVMTQCYVIRSNGPFPGLPPGTNPQIEPWFHLTRIQPSIVIKINQRLRLQGGGASDLAGRNVGRGRQWLLALWGYF